MGNHHKKRQRKTKPLLLIVCSILLLAISGSVGTWYYLDQKEIAHEKEIAMQTMALVQAKEARLERERQWEEERKALQLKEQQEREAYQAEWDAKVQEQRDRIAREKAEEEERQRKLEEARRKAEEARLEAIRQEQQRAAEEKARLAAEKQERARLSVIMKEQEQTLAYEQAEYNATKPTPLADLHVEMIYQKPELPNGCEITAAAILINYWSGYVDKCLLSDFYLPKKEFKDVNKQRVCGDPYSVYCGNPRYTQGGYYCFAPPVVTAMNNYFSDIGASFTAKDITGASEDTLLSYLDQGKPVIAFATLSMGEGVTFEPSKWLIEGTNEYHIPFLNLHCVVLYGYDEEYIYICDPLKGQIQCKRNSFLRAYHSIGSRAVVVE